MFSISKSLFRNKIISYRYLTSFTKLKGSNIIYNKLIEK